MNGKQVLCSEEQRLWIEYLEAIDAYGHAGKSANTNATTASAARLRLAREDWERHVGDHSCMSGSLCRSVRE
jgi:hypothetical protein